MNTKPLSITKNFILLGFILAKFLLQYLLNNSFYDLHRDEYLHLDQPNHLAWGYLSVPPVTSWISYTISFLGGSIFWIRFFPAMFGALTMLVVWKAMEELKGTLFALILGSTCMLLSVFVRLNFLYQPNSLDVLSWTLFYFILIKYFNTENPKWLYVATVVFALGFLNKYNIVFMLIGVLPAMLLAGHENFFIRREFYISILLGLILIAPNLLWQYNNHFPVVSHLKELSASQLVKVNRWDFVKDQIFYFIGALPVIIASLYGVLFYRPLKKFKFFFWSFFITLLVFIYFRAKSYYAMGVYPIYFALGATFIGSIQIKWIRYVKPVFIAIPVIFYILLYRIVFSIEKPREIISNAHVYKKYGLLRWEDGKDHILPQDFADMLGWKELAIKVDAICAHFPANEPVFILCDNYGQAGAINYYAKHIKTKAVAFNADYINWFDLNTKIENVIRVKVFEDSGDELEGTGPLFETSYVAGSITNPLAREYKTTIFVFKNAKIDINERLRAEMKKERLLRGLLP